MSIDNENGQTYVTVGQDSQLKIWDLPELVEGEAAEPTHSIPLDSVPHSVSHIANSTDFVTCGEGISVWKALRFEFFSCFNFFLSIWFKRFTRQDV